MKKKTAPDFLSLFMRDPARARVLRVLTLNEHDVFTPVVMGKRAALTTASAKSALVGLERMGIARKGKVAAQKVKAGKKRPFEDVWFFDPHFAHARALAAFVREISPLDYDEVLDTLKKTGRLSVVVLSGTFVGDTSRPADIVVAADSLSERRMESAMRTLESIFGRELRYAAFPTAEFRYRLTIQDKLLRDTLDFPHRILLDRAKAIPSVA